MAGWSASAFTMYGIDKRQARRKGWRVPEIVLHGLALIGGVIGAWAGRAWFRHKTQEAAFTIVLVAASILWIAMAVLSLVF